MLTRMQRKTFDVIAAGIAAKGFAPTFDEIARGLGLKSKSGVHRLIEGLEGRGFIRRMAKRARAIEIIKTPPGIGDSLAADRERCGKIVATALCSAFSMDESMKIIIDAILAGTSLDEFERRHGFRRPPGLV